MNKYLHQGIIIVCILTLLDKNISMSKKEYINIFASIIVLSIILSLTGMIQGLQIVPFAILAAAGLYVTLLFVKYVYVQKNYSEEV